MKTSDLLLYPSRGTPADVAAYLDRLPPKRRGEVDACVKETYRLSDQYGLDASICIARQCDETGGGSGKVYVSDIWNNRLNCGGLGVTDGTDEMLSFPDGKASARAFVAHMVTYAQVEFSAGELTPADDPRYQATIDAGTNGTCVTLADLEGKWFTNPQGAENSAARGNAVYPNLPDQGGAPVSGIIFGLVPFPPCEIRDIPTPPNTAWDDLGPRLIRSVTLHRMIGTLAGTDSWFRGGGAGTALTDYGVGVKATDGEANAGRMMRWNDPHGRRSPWASGPVSAPYGDGKKFVDIYGVSAVNRDTTAIEISGDQQTPLDDKSREAISAFMAYWADQYEVPHTEYPIIGGENNRSHVIWHQEFTIGTGKECPFDVVMAETDALIARARAILAQYQGGTAPAPEPHPPDTSYPAARIPVVPESQGFELVLTGGDHRFRCTHGGMFKTGPSRDAPDGTPSPYAQGQVYTLPYSTVVAEETWLVSKAGSWCMLKNFEPSS
jgi:hypothetical protein